MGAYIKLTPYMHFPLNNLQLHCLPFLYTPTSAKVKAKETLRGSLCWIE